MNLEDLRREYTFEGLNESEVADDPYVQFDVWFQAAIDSKIELPDVMTLATASKTGTPSARIVVLRGLDKDGFVFYTDYGSNKSHDLFENPQASLVFFWRELGRQVRISGAVMKVERSKSIAYFNSRPLERRLAAVASNQSEIISNRKLLEDRYSEIEQEVKKDSIKCPGNWGGFRVVPAEFEFWQGRKLRLHDRIRYRQGKGKSWIVERLAP